MEAVANFYFRDIDVQPIRIQCRADEKFSKIFEIFANKYYANSDDYEFSYNGNLINKDSSIIKLMGRNVRNIDILTKRKLKIMKCPGCVCNNAIIKIENYASNFSECRYGHQRKEIFNNYENSQKIDYSQIECHNNACKKLQSRNLDDFYKCMDCSGPEINNKTTYFCKRCNEQHCKTEGHKTIKYDEKYYYCPTHFNQFISFCDECRENLCDKCQNEHKKNHKIQKLDSFKPDVGKIKNNLEEIKKKTRDLKNIVNRIKNTLDGAVSLIEKYYTIAQDLIGKYETYNKTLKNYQVLETIEHLNISSKEIMSDLNNIIKGNTSKEDWIKKCKILIGIYEGDRDFYKGENDDFEDMDDYQENTIENNGNNFEEVRQSKHSIKNN